MSTSKAGPFTFLPDSAFCSEAEGRARLAASFAGRARHLYELATGSNPFPNDPPASPLNPQGRIGADLSGPPWGSALLHPIAWVSGRATSANVTGEKSLGTATFDSPLLVGPWRIWNRPHDALELPGIAPYSRGFISLRAQLTTAGSATMTMRIGQGDGIEADVGREASFSVTSTTEATFADTTVWIDLRPGTNRLWFQFSLSASSDEPVMVDSILVYQRRKRSH